MFNCPDCAVELPAESAKCYFCGWKPVSKAAQAATAPETAKKAGAIYITGETGNSGNPYATARKTIVEWHRTESYRQMARNGGLKSSKVASMAAALSHVARGGENRPAVLVFLGLEEPMKPAPICTNPACDGYGQPHVWDCQTQTVTDKKPPTKRRPKRTNRATINTADMESAYKTISSKATPEQCRELGKMLLGE